MYPQYLRYILIEPEPEGPSKVLMAAPAPTEKFPTKPEDCGIFDDSTLNDELQACGYGFGEYDDSPGTSSIEYSIQTVESSADTDSHVNCLDGVLEDIRNYEWEELLNCPEPSKIPIALTPHIPDDEMCEVIHPVHKTPYMVSKKIFCSLLEHSGTRVQTYSKDSKEIARLVEQFCDHAHIEFMNAEKARMIKNSGYIIDVLSTKKGKSGRYRCLFCPLLGSMTKSFPNKENLIRHNALHLRYTKFQCGYCDYKHFRKDTIDQHINLKHPTKTHEKRIFKLK
jgi:hypothetical protein